MDHEPNRIQGTDGIRREVRRQDDPSLAGLSPWEAFTRAGVITERFLEGYAYAFAREFVPAGRGAPEVVVGWDPRDPGGLFTRAVVRGVRKAGAAAAVAGVVPTPAVPMAMMARGAAAALMITASHNPAGQNGVKIFLGPAGLKLLPADDVELTAAVRALDWDALAAAPAAGDARDVSADTGAIFRRFHLNARNAWLDAAAKPLADFILVVDPARGSYSRLAAGILSAFGAEVYEVNADEGDGRVNWRSGVADLEGVRIISFGDITPNGRFGGYEALSKLEYLANVNDAALCNGQKTLAAVVFDADGDRFFLVVYDATAGAFAVLSGDEVAALQAAAMARTGRGAGFAFINTVESDLAVSAAAGALGFAPILKPVGDKWILTEAWRIAAGAPGGESAAVMSGALAPVLSAGGPRPFETIPYGVGCEETGHSITFGNLVTPRGNVPFAAGNGLKSALNVLGAVARLRRELAPRALYEHLASPFARGYKGNGYVYYTRKERLLRGAEAYAALDRLVTATLARRAPALRLERRTFAEEPDLLYWAGFDGDRQALGVFCRNSGTEDKSALYVRAEAAWAAEAAALEEELYPAFYALTKDRGDARARAELAWLAGGARPAEAEVARVAETFERVMTPAGPTARGRAVLAALAGAEKFNP